MIRHVIPFFTRAVAAIGATVVLLASVADAQPQPSPQVGDVVAGPSAAGTKFRLIIEKGVYLTVSYITGDSYPRILMEEQLKVKHDQLSKADTYEIDRLSKIL